MRPIVTFIVHGQISRKSKLLRLINETFAGDFVVKVKQTTEFHHADLLTTKALEEGTDFLIAVGGDGTVHEVVNAYLSFGLLKEVPIGIIPHGRGNDFVKSLGIHQNLKSLLNAVQKNQPKSIDVGWMMFSDSDRNIINRYFVNISDIGLGGLAVQMIKNRPKFLSPNISYAWAIFKSLIFYKSQNVKIITHDWSYEGNVMSLCMANGKYFGSGLCIAPEAELDDGIAEIVIIGNVGIWDYLTKISQLKSGKKIIHPKVFYGKAKKCSIESQVPIPIDMDGEFVGYTPLKMEMLQKKVKILI
ncbi:diacylglycerol/lipid kinase family protein [Shivajiella indica]|uniref:Diacylglycerol/lipid kinase family protein n=1 Tax=Shivajiella indica TaxID=872115 RepID=A0ABW5BAL8_9BACT